MKLYVWTSYMLNGKRRELPASHSDAVILAKGLHKDLEELKSLAPKRNGRKKVVDAIDRIQSVLAVLQQTVEQNLCNSKATEKSIALFRKRS